MPTTFSVISLGVLADIDTTEGNNNAENAAALSGLTFGDASAPLLQNASTWSPVGDPAGAYDMHNLQNDQFSIDGGPAQTFDGLAVYAATITYADGSTATISAVLAQDVDGNAYLMPELSANTDQDALEAGPIQSLTLGNVLASTNINLGADRQDWDILTCFAQNTRVKTAVGPKRVENIKVGDLIPTKDHGLQVVRWIGQTTVKAKGAHAPVLIKEGAIGNSRDIIVSQQHRMVMQNWQAALHTGEDETLVPAKHLINGDTICLIEGGTVTYYHMLFDQHELIWSESILTESFHPAEMAFGSLEMAAQREILDLFPQLALFGARGYSATARTAAKRPEGILSGPASQAS